MSDKWGTCSRDEFYEFADRARSAELPSTRYPINSNGYFYKRKNFFEKLLRMTLRPTNMTRQIYSTALRCKLLTEQ